MKIAAFLFFVVFGIVLGIIFAQILNKLSILSQWSFLGMRGPSIVAIILAVPIADWSRRKIFGDRSFGERS